MTSYDLQINYFALCISILTPSTPELSFSLMMEHEKPSILRKCRKDVTKEDVKDMVALKEDLTYKEIAEIYGLKKMTVCSKILRYKKKSLTISSSLEPGGCRGPQFFK